MFPNYFNPFREDFISVYVEYTTVSTVISVRIKKEIKEELEKHGIDIDQEVRKFLEELYLKVKAKEYVDSWVELLKDVKPSEEGFSEKSVREDRESH